MPAKLYALQRENELLAIELKMSPSRGFEENLSDSRQRLRRDYDFDDGIIRGKGSPMEDVCRMLCAGRAL
jgi:two-component system response regulator HupR/HoxA